MTKLIMPAILAVFAAALAAGCDGGDGKDDASEDAIHEDLADGDASETDQQEGEGGDPQADDAADPQAEEVGDPQPDDTAGEDVTHEGDDQSPDGVEAVDGAGDENLPGTCEGVTPGDGGEGQPCAVSEHCDGAQYCNQTRCVCYPPGECIEESDCSNPGNDWHHDSCTGYATCEGGLCVWTCS
jgi:hypothetical protein